MKDVTLEGIIGNDWLPKILKMPNALAWYLRKIDSLHTDPLDSIKQKSLEAQ